jgi:hypothetical protein
MTSNRICCASVHWHGNENCRKPRASKEYLHFASAVKRSSDGTLLIFHWQGNLFAFIVTFCLNYFISIKFKINDFYGLNRHLSNPPVLWFVLSTVYTWYVPEYYLLNSDKWSYNEQDPYQLFGQAGVSLEHVVIRDVYRPLNTDPSGDPAAHCNWEKWQPPGSTGVRG